VGLSTVPFRALPVAFALVGLVTGSWPVQGQAQESAQTATITGVVRDAETDVAIGGAKVILTASGTQRRIEVSSNATGEFRTTELEPGVYFARAEAEGYVKPSALGLGPNTIVVSESASEVDVQIRLHRSATIRGTVLDSKQRAPLSNVSVRALGARPIKGSLTFLPVSEPVSTDDSGSFQIRQLPPGEIVLEFAGDSIEELVPERLADYTEEHPRPLVLPRSYWPPGPNSARRPTLALRPGADLDLGRIELERQPMHRLRGLLRAPGCTGGDGQVLVSLQERFGSTTMFRARKTLPCETDYTLVNLVPGASYRLSAWMPEGEIRDRAYFEVSFDAVVQDAEQPIELQRPTMVSCNVDLPSSLPQESAAGIRLRLAPVAGLAFGDEPTPSLAEKTHFELPLLARDQYEVLLTGLRHPYYVKRISYNGTALEGKIFEYAPAALEHNLAIEIGDDAATLSGEVKVDGDPVPGLQVILAYFPLRMRNNYPEYVTVETDDDGRFRRDGLQPSTYRVLAATSRASMRLQNQQDIVEALRGSREVSVEPGQSATIALHAYVLE
jgi:Carboxypeptidase regulatory-like domain